MNNEENIQDANAPQSETQPEVTTPTAETTVTEEQVIADRFAAALGEPAREVITIDLGETSDPESVARTIKENLFQPKADVEALTGTTIEQKTEGDTVVVTATAKTDATPTEGDFRVNPETFVPEKWIDGKWYSMDEEQNARALGKDIEKDTRPNPGFPADLAAKTVAPNYDFELPYFESKHIGGQRLAFATEKFVGVLNNNGTTVEAVLAMMLDRIEFINKFPCPENVAAIAALQAAQLSLGRTASVRTLRPGHRYELPLVENTDILPGVVIQFIEKEKQEDTTLLTINDGTTNESVLDALLRFIHSEHIVVPNEVASNVEEALRQLNLRRADRRSRGVEGQHKA